MGTIWHACDSDENFGRTNFTDYTGSSNDNRVIGGDAGGPAKLRKTSGGSSSAITLSDNKPKLVSLTVSLYAARKSGTSKASNWSYSLGVGNTVYHTGTAHDIDGGLYNDNKYAWHTWNTGLTETITNATLLDKMKDFEDISLWWTTGYGWIGANTYLECRAQVLAVVPNAPVIQYPSNDDITYNLQPYVYITCNNPVEAYRPATLSLSTDGSRWVDVTATKSGNTLIYQGAIPSEIAFSTTGSNKKIYARARSTVGTGSQTNVSFTISTISNVTSGNKIISNNYTSLAQAIQNLYGYYGSQYTAPATVANQIITASQMASLSEKLKALPPKKEFSIKAGDIITAATYNTTICNAIKQS